MVAISNSWGVSKPDLGFFEHAIGAVSYAAEEILYVGDRLDNGIRPAAEAGLATALIRRGPWGVIQEHQPEADEIATIRISSLAELPEWVAALNQRDQ